MHNKDSDIEFDVNKAKSNLRQHGVSFTPAEQVLKDPLALTIEDPDSVIEHRYATMVLDGLGRVLVVVYTPRAGQLRLLSTRKASSNEAKHDHAKTIRFW